MVWLSEGWGGGLRNKLNEVQGDMTFLPAKEGGGGWVIFGRQ